MKQGGYAKENASILALTIRVMDWLIVVLSGYISFLYLEGLKNFPAYETIMPTNYLFALIIVFLMCAWLFPAFYQYKTWRGESIFDELKQIFVAWSIVSLAFLTLLVFTKYSEHFSREWLIWWFSSGLCSLAFSRVFIRWGLRKFREKGLNQRHIVIIGSGDLGIRVAKKIKSAEWTGLNIKGFFSDIPGQQKQHADIADLPDLGPVADVVSYVEEHNIDQVWIAMSLKHIDKIKSLIDELHSVTTDIRLIPDIFSLRLLNHSISEIDGIPVINMSVTPMVGANRLTKWVEDKVLSIIILMLISPLLLFIMLAIKLTSRGAVFYSQERVSWNGRKFNMLKFRSMEEQSESDQTGQVIWGKANTKKITPIGKFLRSTSLDELPQFINVLKGDMSIVGPRPERTIFVEQFKHEIPSYMQKHLVKAGITGWAQINGWRGDTNLNKRIEYDLWYVEHWSLWLDLRIIIGTLSKIFFDKNAR
jgi:putative colanic acid biosynthesis UDP-glucose lipid carrier transferase